MSRNGKGRAGRRGKPQADPARTRQQFQLAAQCIQSGDDARGEKILARLDQQTPDNFSILFNLGFARHRLKRFNEACRCYRRCVELKPDSADAWHNLATAAREGGRSKDAIEAYRRLLQMRPGNPDYLNDLAGQLRLDGALREAAGLYRQVIDGNAGNHVALLNLADTLADLGDVDDAATAYRQALALRRDPDAAMRLVLMLDDAGRVDQALDALVDVEDHRARTLLSGNLHLKRGELDDAEASYRRLLEIDPDAADGWNNLGLVLGARYDRAGAEKCYRRALGHDEEFTEAWKNLADLRRFESADDPDLEAMARLWRRLPGEDDRRIHLGFALGKALDEIGEYRDAFDRYQAANSRRRRQLHFDLDALVEHGDRIRDHFTGAGIRDDRGSDSRLPVFIVGMPRSGTTLLEQILSMHPRLHGGGELLEANRLIQGLESAPGAGPYPECLGRLPRSTWDALLERYLGALQDMVEGTGESRLSDKMPYNFFHLGLLREAFPGSAVLVCERNPLDTCLSCYFNYFPRGMDFTYDFEDLAGFYEVYRRMMTFWEARMPTLRVSYEDLVGEPGPLLRRVLEFIGLDWDDRLLEFHGSSRRVQTLSTWQVRQPLHRRSRERWRNYRGQLAPLARSLEQRGVSTGWE